MDNETFTLDIALRMIDGISDPVRMEIIFLLAGSGAMNVGEITAQFKISRPAISHHLKVLKDAKIVHSERTGQEIYYRLDRESVVAGLRKIADEIEMCCEATLKVKRDGS